MRGVDALIAKRLNSSWGLSSTKKRESEGVLHRLIADLATDTCVDSPASCSSPSHDEQDRQWNHILRYSLDNPHEVTELDRRGRSCLSASCAKDPPAFVIESMMEACRFGVEASPDKTGYSALHIAIRNHASMDVILALMKSRRVLEVSDHRGNTPLHLVCSCEYTENPVDLVRAILRLAPHIANRDNAQGRTALHVALEQKADIEVLKLLVEAAPESVLKNACGSTPLVVALQHNAPLPVYQLLVQANPEITKVKDDFGRYPLRCALEHRCSNPQVIRLLCSSPETVLEVDTIGRTPLHMTLDRPQLFPDICDILLDVAPQAACLRTRYSELPIQTCYRRYSHALTALEYRPTATASSRDVSAWWHVLIQVLRASSQESLLHTALVTEAPLHVLTKLLHEHPSQIQTLDRYGQSALVVACRYSETHVNKSAIVQLLLNAPPSAEALSWAAATGGVDSRVMYQLVCAYPRALVSTHHDGMYPCLLAATVQPTVHTKEEERHADQLSVIHTLVVAAPELIRACLQ
jgi:ankyrin repeat protein